MLSTHVTKGSPRDLTSSSVPGEGGPTPPLHPEPHNLTYTFFSA